MRFQELYTTQEEHEVDVLDEVAAPFNLIVWNDEVNTFDWVIDTLMQFCGHDQEQAEQCTLIIHFKGKCAVKSGDLDTLKPICDGITERGIGATIEEAIG
jgi:ATP-dependent Clp protease adaptor protein ClpS